MTKEELRYLPTPVLLAIARHVRSWEASEGRDDLVLELVERLERSQAKADVPLSDIKKASELLKSHHVKEDTFVMDAMAMADKFNSAWDRRLLEAGRYDIKLRD